MAAGCLLLLACGGEEPLEFAEWSVPVPDGATVHSLPAIPDEARTERLPLERDLVLREAFGVPFYSPRDVAVDDRGRAFVLDGGNHRVVAFDGEGEALFAFGREGEGPGEFQLPYSIHLVGRQVMVHDLQSLRLTAFDSDGGFVEQHSVEGNLRPQGIEALGEDLLLVTGALRAIRNGRAVRTIAPFTVGRYTYEGELLESFVQIEPVESRSYEREVTFGFLAMEAPEPLGVLGRDGSIYVTSGEEYQVLALDGDGSTRWALRVAHRAPVPDEAGKQEALAELQKRNPELRHGDVAWPDRLAAIRGLAVDGHGDLHVFPFTGREPESGLRRVDVYSPDGTRRFAGWSDLADWNAAWKDHVWTVETEPGSGERVVVRYRLDEPF